MTAVHEPYVSCYFYFLKGCHVRKPHEPAGICVWNIILHWLRCWFSNRSSATVWHHSLSKMFWNLHFLWSLCFSGFCLQPFIWEMGVSTSLCHKIFFHCSLGGEWKPATALLGSVKSVYKSVGDQRWKQIYLLTRRVSPTENLKRNSIHLSCGHNWRIVNTFKDWTVPT